jgi:hypothetical protein
LSAEAAHLRAQAQEAEAAGAVLRREVAGLREDNDRINRMYLVVERQAYEQQQEVE